MARSTEQILLRVQPILSAMILRAAKPGESRQDVILRLVEKALKRK
jgi:hypothetical protein